MKNHPEGSYMANPGNDEELGLAEMASHDVFEQTHWSLSFAKMAGPNGDVDASGFKAAIDSGTSLSMGPGTLLQPLLKGITVE